MEWLFIGLLLVGLALQALIALKIRGRFQHLDVRLERLESRILGVAKATKEAVNERAMEVQNSAALAALRFDYPVFFGQWSIDSFLARTLAQIMLERRPRVIVELGSGSSTLLIARCSERIGYQPLHIAVDHESGYLASTKHLAELNNLAHRVRFEECPLITVPEAGQPWYGGLQAKLKGIEIDLLIVDGPPASTHRLARQPALPILHDLLSSSGLVVLDDAARPEERLIVEGWLSQFPAFEATWSTEGHGAAILKRRQAAAAGAPPM